MDKIMNRMFTRLGNTGMISNAEMAKIMTLSLIDDYRDEMIECNSKWKRILDDIEFGIIGSSCLF